VIASSGFRELGPEGAELEAECVKIARQYQLRLLGPNCIGIIDTHLPLDITFLPPPSPIPGELAFISHSGAMCATVIDWARGQGFGFSRLISLGNQADLTETDMLAPVANDPHTQVITLYLEGLPDGRRFITEASHVTRQIPVIALKVGRFSSGQRAAASHTGALAGQESAYDAAFRRAGVIRVNTSEELFDWARALACCPLPSGKAIAVLTNAGGPGVTAADALEANGLQMADLDPGTIQRLKQILPPAANCHNPVDMLAGATPETYAQCLQLLLDDQGVDGILLILPRPPLHPAEAVTQAVIPLIQQAKKPVVVSLMGAQLIQTAAAQLRQARIPEYRFPERAAAALAALYQRHQMLSWQQPAPRYTVNKEAANELMAGAPTGFLPPDLVTALLQLYGLPIPPARLAQTAMQAVKHAMELGFPVALKIVSPDITHKTDAGGVLLGLQNGDAVQQGFSRVIANVQHHSPGALIQGVQVQRMLPDGQEVILGVVQDAQFGPLMMFGTGGVEVEGKQDVAFALAPLTPSDAEFMLEATWAGRRLKGFRRLPPADRGAVLEALYRLSQLAQDFPQLSEIEINPLLVLPEGEGAYALDVRIKNG
jgi:acetyltransferase